MMNLDLKSARDAGTRAAEGVLECYDTVMNVRYESAAVSLAAITAALPHILEALADELDAEADSEYRGHGEWSPEHQAAKILRAKAEEARA